MPESESVSLCFSLDFVEAAGTFMASSRVVFGLLVTGGITPKRQVRQAWTRLSNKMMNIISPSLLLRQGVHWQCLSKQAFKIFSSNRYHNILLSWLVDRMVRFQLCCAPLPDFFSNSMGEIHEDLSFLSNLMHKLRPAGPKCSGYRNPCRLPQMILKGFTAIISNRRSSWKLTLRGFFLLKYWRLRSRVDVLHKHQSNCCCSLLRNIHACAATKNKETGSKTRIENSSTNSYFRKFSGKVIASFVLHHFNLTIFFCKVTIFDMLMHKQ